MITHRTLSQKEVALMQNALLYYSNHCEVNAGRTSDMDDGLSRHWEGRGQAIKDINTTLGNAEDVTVKFKIR